MVSMILRPYIHNPYGINDIKCPILWPHIFTTHMVSMILRPYIHKPYGINDIKALYSTHMGPIFTTIWYQ